MDGVRCSRGVEVLSALRVFPSSQEPLEISVDISNVC